MVDSPDLGKKPGMVQLAELNEVGKPFSWNIKEQYDPGEKRCDQAVSETAQGACNVS